MKVGVGMTRGDSGMVGRRVGLVRVKNYSGMWNGSVQGGGQSGARGRKWGHQSHLATFPLAFLAGASLLGPQMEGCARGRVAWVTPSHVAVLPGSCSPAHPLRPGRACFSLFFKSLSFLSDRPTLAGVQA